MFIKSMNNLRRCLLLMFVILLPLLLLSASITRVDTSNTNNSHVSIQSLSVRNQAVDDLATKINKELKPELEKEFGPLNDRIIYNEKEMYGEVIGLEYVLPEDKRLDDTWGNKVVEALGRLGIAATYEGNEVRADKQKIAGKEASSIQLTTQRTLEEPDVIGFTAMFPRG